MKHKQLSKQLLHALKMLKTLRPHRQVDTHHIIPKSRSDFNVHHPSNLIRLEHDWHFAWHRVFWNTTPQEQLAVWLDVNNTVISPKARQLLDELINMDEHEFYAHWCVK